MNSEQPQGIEAKATVLTPDYDDVQNKLRKKAVLLDAEKALCDTVWYGRHQLLKYNVETAYTQIVDELPPGKTWADQTILSKRVWIDARLSARKVEEELGVENLGPFTDFEWGMINGKLSAIRWALGDHWDCLST